MSTSKNRVFVLVGDEQTPLSPQDVAGVATAAGFKVAAQRFGFSETTLRAFLAVNGFVARKNVSYEKANPSADDPRVSDPPREAYEAVTPIGG